MAKRIRQMAIGHEDLHVAETRRYADAPVSLAGTSDFAGVCLQVIREHLAVSEANESVDEVVGTVARHIDAVVWNRFERRVCGWLEVPVELHLYATRPLDYGIDSDWVLEWFDDDFSASRPRMP